MAAEILSIHSQTPEMRKVEKVATAMKDGAVILYPTDTGFTLGCELSNKNAIARLRQIRDLPSSKSLTFLCDSLSHISEFAIVNNQMYRTLKRLIPGPYTFILPASKKVPKFAQNPKRSSAGIRVPDHNLSQALLKEVGFPIISISAVTNPESYENPEDILAEMSKFVDIAVTSDSYNFVGQSTVIDLGEDSMEIIREGAGIEKVLEYVD